MNLEEIFYLLALQKVKNIGDISAKKLLRHFGSAKAVFEAAKQNEIDLMDIGKIMIRNLKQFNDWRRVENELQYIQQNGIKAVSIFDKDYPYRLQHAPDGPILFFYKGKAGLNHQKMISIVGTRNMTTYGKRAVGDIISALKPFNPLIVSGLAYGVDIEAHVQALKNDLPTIAVLGHGFQRIYPAVHQKIARQMLENGGLISEFWHTDPVDRNNFLKRNRIVAGMSEAVIIIESAEKGGSLVTADIANSYNRDVFAVPGRITDTYSKGCNNLIKRNKAALLTCAQDLIDNLQWQTTIKKTPPKQMNLFVDLSPEEQNIIQFLQENGASLLDDIALNLSMPVSKTAQILLEMELKNILNALPGKKFEII